MILALIIITTIAGALLALYLQSRRRLDDTVRALADARTDLARLEERLRNATTEQARLNAEAEERFRNLANRVLVSNSELLREQNSRRLAEVLAPMKSDLDQFRRLVVERYDREAGERLSLGERIKDLVQLNHTIGQETRRLTDALKGNAKVRGDWGEMILDNILERSGFRRGVDYSVQETVTGEGGNRLRPDVVISYTECRKLVIDSKVSIQDYLAMLNAETDDSRERHARAHIASVKSHIAELARKSINIKFTPQIVKGREGRARISSFLKTFLDLDIFHVQFNVVGHEILRCAQERPEDYKSLLVRVAGYSAYFVELSREIQEDILSRTAHEL